MENGTKMKSTSFTDPQKQLTNVTPEEVTGAKDVADKFLSVWQCQKYGKRQYQNEIWNHSSCIGWIGGKGTLKHMQYVLYII